MTGELPTAQTSTVRRVVKLVALRLAGICVFPLAALSGFGRLVGPFVFWGYVLAPIPGRYFGRFLRIAYYRLTLDRVGADFDIEIGSRFGSPRVTIGDRVGISPGCTICACDIGDGCRIGSGVRIIGGYRQHGRDRLGVLTDDLRYDRISIGRHVFIGVDALVMANVGAYATVGAGSVVYDAVQPGTTVVGNPAQWRWSSRRLAQLAAEAESGGAQGNLPSEPSRGRGATAAVSDARRTPSSDAGMPG